LGQLAGKVILITGAFGQAGQSAVRMFLQRGAIVVANDFVPVEQFPDMAKLQKQYGPERLMFVQADMNVEEQVEAVVDVIDRQYGRLDGSYHNAYTCVEKPIREMTLAEWESTVKGTLTSTFLLCKAVLPLMIRSGGGSIVNTSSVRGHVLHPGSPAYAAAKAGVNQFTRVLAVEHAHEGIRANVVVPGDFKSEQEYMLLSDADKRMIAGSALMARTGKPDEINEVAAFLLSDAAAYVTASLYAVDGGFGV